jgi:hypothetical protein
MLSQNDGAQVVPVPGCLWVFVMGRDGAQSCHGEAGVNIVFEIECRIWAGSLHAVCVLPQDHLTISDDDSGSEVGSELVSLPSAPSSLSEAMHASPVIAWDKPVAPIPNGPIPLPRAPSPVLPPPNHVMLPAAAEVVSPMFDSSTDSFGPDALAVSITEEILSEAQDPPVAIVSAAAQLPLAPPVTAPIAAPVAPPAKAAAPTTTMSWSSIVTGKEVRFTLGGSMGRMQVLCYV